MQRLIRLFACLLLAGLLGACVGPVPKIDAAQTTLSKIKTLTVIRPPQTKAYVVLNFGHPGLGFGLIGGIVAATDMNNKRDQLTAVLKQENLALPASLTERLVSGLTKEGYQAAAGEAPWETKDDRDVLPYEKIQSDADAVLVVAPTIVGFVDGGLTASTGGSYVPTIATVVTLLDRDHKTVLYRGYHVAGWQPKAEGWRHTPPKSRYPNFTDLMQKPADTAASLIEASDAIASTVAADLHRQTAAADSAAPAAPAEVPVASGAQSGTPPRQP